MAISEESRHEMYVRLEEVLGAQVAATVMEHLPPVGWADVATKRDLDAFQVVMTSDLDALRVATRRDLDAFQVVMTSDLDALRVATTRDFDALEQRFTSKLDTLELSFRAELRGEVNRLLFWLFPTGLTLVALAFGAGKLG